MDDHSTRVQFSQPTDGTRVNGDMPTPRNPNDPTKRVTIELTPEQASFVDRYSAYLNALYFVQNDKRMRVQWKRKSTSESFVDNQVTAQSLEMKAMFRAIGEIPAAAGDSDEMLEYAKKADSWKKKRSK